MTGDAPFRNPLEDAQGPDGLAELLWHPPYWLQMLIVAGALAALGLAAYRFYQADAELDWQQHMEMQIIAATILGVGTGTTLMVDHASQPFFVDVGVGWAVGYGAVLLAQWRRLQRPIAKHIDDRQNRYAATWALLAVLSFVPRLTIDSILFPRIAMILAMISAAGALHASLADEIADMEVFDYE